ncbi:MAG TPA: sigma-70 family RNA polymerase sigma factor [Bryobacteraceae bacterium]
MVTDLHLLGTMKQAASDAQSDFQLIQLSRQGDREAFGELVKRHYGSCVNLATYILRNRAEAEDEVQQAFWKAFEHLDQYLGEAEFCTWLLRIVVNECRMLMRDKKRARFLYIDAGHSGSGGRQVEPHSPGADPEYDAVKCEMIEMLRTEMRRIPPLFRKVILLRDMEGLPMPEVADRLGITVPAAKSRLLRARNELRGRVMRRCGAAKHYGKANPFKALRHSSLAAA